MSQSAPALVADCCRCTVTASAALHYSQVLPWLLADILHCAGPAVHRVNNFKGSIYMVFDYMDHDLTGLMERHGGFTVPQVRPLRSITCTAAARHGFDSVSTAVAAVWPSGQSVF